jgi:hypothetical protein
MPDTKEISALTTAESTSASDLFETALPNAMTETGYISRKVTLNTIANFLLNTLLFPSLHTTVKNIIGAINELAQGSGQSLDTLNDVDIDSQTLADGQGIVYDAAAQKWKNGAVSGGGHTYSTTEQVVGTWIDGSPVYEKTIITNSSVTNADVDVDISNLNVDLIIYIGGEYSRKVNNLELYYPWGENEYNTGNEIVFGSYCRFYKTNNSITYKIIHKDNSTTDYQRFTIRYTKSST